MWKMSVFEEGCLNRDSPLFKWVWLNNTDFCYLILRKLPYPSFKAFVALMTSQTWGLERE